MLTLIESVPFEPFAWPGHWCWTRDSGSSFEVVQFCCSVKNLDSLPTRLHISADNRYKLYLDGCFIGLGPQRGTPDRYFLDTYDLSSLKNQPGDHLLSAIVWYERETAPSAQISSQPGFLAVLEYDNGRMRGTLEQWRYKRWEGNDTIPVPEDAFCIGVGYDMTGYTGNDLCPSQEALEKEFLPVRPLGYSRNHHQGHPQLLLQWQLHPRTLPAMKAEKHPLGQCRRIITENAAAADESLQSKISQMALGAPGISGTVTIPARSRYRILLDKGVLVAGYPTLLVSGGEDASVGLTYQEALQSTEDVRSKGNRNEVGQRTLVGVTDRFRLQGKDNVMLEPLWWRGWRYIEIDIQTARKPLLLKELAYRSTGYPLTQTAQLTATDWFTRLMEPGFRTMELCAGETYMDCPYYEQLQYVGDSRIQALLSYVICNDDRLARETIDAFDRSRLPNGLTQGSYPNRHISILPLFSLLHISMLDDFLMWRGDIDFVRERLRGVETILYAFEQCRKENGLIGKLPGWTFVDWTRYDGWINGQPPAADEGDSFLVSFFYLYALQQAANLFLQTGNNPRADQLNRQAQALRQTLRHEAFDPNRGMFRDAPNRPHLSQHTNIFAILTDTCRGAIDSGVLLRSILNNPNLAHATVYFKFYLYEAMYHAGCADQIWPDLKLWHDMLDNGLTTFAEKPEPTRSDCHAWSSHPLYHFVASIMGIRPAAPGCATLSINPARRTETVPPLPDQAGVQFDTPKGRSDITIRAKNDGWDINAKLPPDR